LLGNYLLKQFIDSRMTCYLFLDLFIIIGILFLELKCTLKNIVLSIKRKTIYYY